MKTYPKKQILDTLAKQRLLLLQDNAPESHLDMFDCFVNDFLCVLEGRITPTIAKETLLVPGLGFVPVVGTVGGHGVVNFYKDNDNQNGSAS